MSNILVVDDDPDINEVVSQVLESRGHSVRTAENGREALEVVQTWRPNLVLLDLMMPVMTGDEFLKEVQRNHVLDQVPIIVVSAWADEAARFPGVAAVVRKPFELRTLLDTVNDLLG